MKSSLMHSAENFLPLVAGVAGNRNESKKVFEAHGTPWSACLLKIVGFTVLSQP